MAISRCVMASSLGAGRDESLTTTIRRAGSTHSHWAWMPTPQIAPSGGGPEPERNARGGIRKGPDRTLPKETPGPYL